jgi:LysM repeat protein
MTKQNKIFFTFIMVAFVCPAYLIAQTTRAEYIQQYKNLAVREMKRTGIPASITMAQALLESDNGNSKLAKRANNHFGVKCGGLWEGKTFHQNDDTNNECFRKYEDVEESYKDHSAFLQRDRYKELYKLSPTDYKEWAHGLKKGGYATNPNYPAMIIKIIEENNLHELDLGNQRIKKDEKDQQELDTLKSDIKPLPKKGEFTIGPRLHEIKLNNRVKYIVVKASDSFSLLNKEFDLMAWQLPKYNELTKEAELSEGQVLYLQPKRNKAETGLDFHQVKKGESMYDISQKYAIKQSKLYKMNLMPEGSVPKEGSKLILRKARK